MEHFRISDTAGVDAHHDQYHCGLIERGRAARKYR